jgi:hypothetical protein
MVSIKDVRKGSWVQLRNGWEACVEDNTVNQHTRVCTVYGFETECGSVYSTDIVKVRTPDGSWEHVVHTPAQVKAHNARKGWGGF